jgi:hypothetical protein
MPRFLEYRAAGIGGYLHTTPDDTVFMAECLICGAQKAIERKALKSAVQGLEGISDMGKRLRCRACGEKNAKLMTGFYTSEEI